MENKRSGFENRGKVKTTKTEKNVFKQKPSRNFFPVETEHKEGTKSVFFFCTIWLNRRETTKGVVTKKRGFFGLGGELIFFEK